MNSLSQRPGPNERRASQQRSGWDTYHQAIELLNRDEWGAALRLLAAAETCFRSADDQEGLWRALSGQAAAHWGSGDHSLALARATAALRTAEDLGDTLGAGLTAWQLAVLVLREGNYRQAAELLLQAEDALGRQQGALPLHELAASAQLCLEITRWQQLAAQRVVEQHSASELIAAIQRNLLARLTEAAAALRTLWGQRGRESWSERLLLLPTALAPALPEPVARSSLTRRLTRWWRRLVDGAPQQTLPAPVAPSSLLTSDPPPAPSAAPTFTLEPATPAPALHDVAQEAASTTPPPAELARFAPPPRRAARLVVTCFGPFRVLVDDRPLERWESARARTVFKYLVTRRSTPVPKEILAELFWPDSEPELARRSLHQAIYCLRQTFKRVAPDLTIVQYADDCYQLSPTVSIWVDSDEFAASVRVARSRYAAGDTDGAMQAYAVALDLVGGTFLEEDRYDAWADELRQSYTSMYIEALHRLARHAYGRGEYSAAILYGQRLLQHDSCDEEAHLLLMRCYVAQGLRHLAVRQYQLCVSALRAELGLPPSEELEGFYRRVVEAGRDG